MPTVGDKWKAAREMAGLTAIDAARLAGLHKNTIYDLEKGKDGATLRVMRHVADIYGKSLAEILTTDATPVEVLPVEYRPLAEALQPLTFEARVSIVKNIASNLRFMSQLISVADGNNAEHVSKTSTRQKDAGMTFGASPGNASPESNDGGRASTETPATGELRRGSITDHPHIDKRPSVQPAVQDVRPSSSGTPESPKRRRRGAK